MYLKKLKIGDVELENNILLAPMAGITDLPFRIICEKYNPGLVCTEMISSKGLFYNDEKTKKLLNMAHEKRPIAVQIFGNEVETMVYAAKYVSQYADIIDINMGCPAPKIVKNGDGSKLLQNLDLVEEIVKNVVEAVNKPVTVKIRKGWNNNNIVAVEAAKRIERAGAAAITIHGRTREEFYTGTADWDIIREVKQNVKIPVIGNGDIKCKEDALKIFEHTGVDGIMIGRATLGNPWIFKQVIEYLKNNTATNYYEPTLKEKLDIMLEHIDMEVKEKGEVSGIREMRKHICYYLKGLPNASEIKEKINKLENQTDVEQTLKEYFEKL